MSNNDIWTNNGPPLVVRRLFGGNIEAAQRLRYQVWREEGAVIQHPERESITDGHDEHSLHWGAFVQGRLVGAARLCLHQQVSETPDAEMFVGHKIPLPVASLNRLVVLRKYRRHGIGSRLDEVRIGHAKELGARAIVAGPVDVEPRKRLLASRGFQFLTGIVGHLAYAPAVSTCACYLSLDPTVTSK